MPEIHMTPRTTIQSWSREQLESAFTQREVQLAEALAQLNRYKAALEKLSGLGGGRSEGNQIAQEALRK